ncbi:hypothetical protein [Microbacterium dauci]|uniref:Uncharacterized protein n=1 Tax=Microbacterium dauci TaxID=3048008 RepID=A0ABT6ZBT0_9MICO|nr:hypothetical protein [Microbacterium sp. LX3-4]MDJ1113398.1 hypothetical protein [Microbacterium sp. LX3-4]
MSAPTHDPTLRCKYLGGPRDGLLTADLPPELSGEKLTGLVSKIPLSQPHQFSLFAVYVCTSETQINTFWIFEFERLEGPNGEQLVVEAPVSQTLDTAG